MNKKERVVKILNVVLFVSILFYNLFLDSLKFRYDYVLISIFLILNFKNTLRFLKKNRILLFSIIIYLFYYLMQYLVLNNFYFESIFSYRYIVLNTLYPILLFITILSINFNLNDVKKIYKIFTIFTYSIIGYGILNYIFRFNLNMAGTNIFMLSFGRIQSFFNNPNAYSFFLILTLCFYLFINSHKKWHEYILISMIILSICLTYSRSGYVIMLGTIIIFLLYVFLKHNNKQKYFNLFMIIYILILTLILPDNNYLYLSFSNEFDSVFGTNVTEKIINYNNYNEEMYYRIISINNRVVSSYKTRNTYHDVAKYLYKNNRFIGVGGLNYFNMEREYFKENGIDYLKEGYPHNNYLFFLARDGIIGLTVIVLLIASIVLLIIKSNGKNSFLLILLILLFLVINLFEDYMIRIGGSNVFYLILSLSYMILNLKKRGKEMKYALIGCGRISPNHIGAAINNNLEIVGICDLIPQKMKEKKELFPVIKDVNEYTDYKEMISKEKPDLVAIATESGEHAKIAIDCLNLGVNVIIEKPIALSIEDANKIIELSKEKNLKVCACHQNRFNKAIQKIRQNLESGSFGKLYYGTAHILWNRNKGYYDQAPWRGTWAQDGGTLMNQCIHNIDLLRWMMGNDIDEVYAYTDNLDHPYIEAEDTGLALIKFKNGTYGILEGTSNVYPKNLEETLYVFGSKGTAKAGGSSVNKIEVWRFEDGEDEEKVKSEFSEEHKNVYGLGHTPLYKDMIEAIVEDRSPYVDAEAGKRALELVLAIYLSASTHKPVKLPLDKCSTLNFVGRFDK